MIARINPCIPPPPRPSLHVPVFQLRFFSKYAPMGPETQGIRLDEDKYASFMPQQFESKKIRVSKRRVKSCADNTNICASINIHIYILRRRGSLGHQRAPNVDALSAFFRCMASSSRTRKHLLLAIAVCCLLWVLSYDRSIAATNQSNYNRRTRISSSCLRAPPPTHTHPTHTPHTDAGFCTEREQGRCCEKSPGTVLPRE